jgi:hypothetical protein
MATARAATEGTNMSLVHYEKCISTSAVKLCSDELKALLGHHSNHLISAPGTDRTRYGIRHFAQFNAVGGSPAGWFGGGGNAGCHGNVAIDRKNGGGGVGGPCDANKRNGVANTGGGGGGAICGTCDGGGLGGTGIVVATFKP